MKKLLFLILLVALVPGVVLAADPAPQSVTLPAPLLQMPAIPAAIQAPAVLEGFQYADLPAIDRRTWAQINTTELALQLSEGSAALRTEARAQLAAANARLVQVRIRTTGNRAWIGAPLTSMQVTGRDESRVGAVAISREFTASFITSVAYLRGLSRLGGFGLDITFILLGLGWIFMINLLDTLVSFSSYLVAFLVYVLKAVLSLVV